MSENEVWFGFDENTGEFTGEYSTVKPHDTRGMVPFVRAKPLSRPDGEAIAPAPAPAHGKGYISVDNGQGMGLPERCVRYRCDGEIVYRPEVPYSQNGDNVCSKCGASYGSDKEETCNG